MAGRGGAMARLVVLCGLLLGLFLMHGSPASAAGGCHAPASHGASAMHEVMADTPEPAGDKAVAPGHGLGHGESCLSTAARGGGLPLAGPLPAPAGVAVAAGAGAVAVRAAEDGCRAPPGGRELLIRVCVART